MTFGLTRGEIILIAFIFALVYGAGLLPKLAVRLFCRPEIAVLTLADGAVSSRALFARGQAIKSDLLGDTGLLPINVFGW